MSKASIRCTACGAPADGEDDTCGFCGAKIVHALGGMGLLRAGKPQLDKAFSEYSARLKKDPDDADAHFGIAAYYVKRKLYKEAVEHLRKSLKHAPIAGEVHYLLAWSFALWRGWTNVMVKQHAERALKLSPKMKEAKSLGLIYRGVIHTRSARSHEDLRKALRELQSAKNVGVRAHLAHIYFFCGETLERAHQIDNAIAMYRAARDYGCTDSKVFIRLGMILKNKGQLKLALRNLQKAHELEPSNAAVTRVVESLKSKVG